MLGAAVHHVLRDVQIGTQRRLRTMLLYGAARDHDDRALPVEALHVLPGHLLEVVYPCGHPETCLKVPGSSVERLCFADDLASASVEHTGPREAGARQEVRGEEEQGVHGIGE